MTVPQLAVSFGEDDVEALICRIRHHLARPMRPWRLEESLMVIRPAALLSGELEALSPYVAHLAGVLAGGEASGAELEALGEWAVDHFRPQGGLQ